MMMISMVMTMMMMMIMMMMMMMIMVMMKMMFIVFSLLSHFTLHEAQERKRNLSNEVSADGIFVPHHEP